MGHWCDLQASPERSICVGRLPRPSRCACIRGKFLAGALIAYAELPVQRGAKAVGNGHPRVPGSARPCMACLRPAAGFVRFVPGRLPRGIGPVGPPGGRVVVHGPCAKHCVGWCCGWYLALACVVKTMSLGWVVCRLWGGMCCWDVIRRSCSRVDRRRLQWHSMYAPWCRCCRLKICG